MRFRLVKKKDLKNIQKLFYSVFKRKISEKFYNWRYLSNRSKTFINIGNKTIFHVGFIEKKLNNKKRDFLLSRHTSMVHRNFQRQGIYSSFFKEFIKKKFKKKIVGIITWPNKDNLNTFKNIKGNYFRKKIYLYSNKKNNISKFKKKTLNLFKFFQSKNNLNKLKKLESEISFFYKDYSYILQRYVKDPHQKYYFFYNSYGKKLTLIIFSLNKINFKNSLIVQDYFGPSLLLNKSMSNFIKYFTKKNIIISFWKFWLTKKKPSYLKHFNRQSLYQNVILLPIKKYKFDFDKYLIMPGDNDIFLKLK